MHVNRDVGIWSTKRVLKCDVGRVGGWCGVRGGGVQSVATGLQLKVVSNQTAKSWLSHDNKQSEKIILIVEFE